MKTNQRVQTMFTRLDKSKFDLDRTGNITEEEIARVRDMVEVEVLGQRATTQKRMAWTAMIAMVVFTGLLVLPVIPDTRVAALSDLIGLFFIAQAGVVGAYMGVTAWISSNRSSRIDTYQQYSSRHHDPRDN